MIIQRIPILNALDRWLLLNAPFVWITRVHIIIVPSAFAFFFFVFLGTTLPSLTVPDYGTDTYWRVYESNWQMHNMVTAISLIASALVTLYWAYHRVRNCNCLPSIRSSLARMDVILSVVCIISINAGPLVFSEIFSKRISSSGVYPVFWIFVLIVGSQIAAFIIASQASPVRNVAITFGVLLANALGIAIVTAVSNGLGIFMGYVWLVLYLACFISFLLQPAFVSTVVLYSAAATVYFLTPLVLLLLTILIRQNALREHDALLTSAMGCVLFIILVFLLEGRLALLRARPR